MTDGAGRQWDFQDAGEVLFVDKPLDWTSYQVVRKLRAMFNVRRVGHAGTLDPKATGLLIVCTGKRTREISRFMDLEKEYTATVELGITTPSFDLETAVTERKSTEGITRQRIEETVASLMGTQEQLPPMYSAVKRDGKPLYRYARRGEVVERKSREIHVARFDVEAVEMPHVQVRIVCSKGTYVRALADELGRRLGCGGTLTALRRTRIGPHRVEDAWSMEGLKDLSASLGLERRQKYADHPPA